MQRKKWKPIGLKCQEQRKQHCILSYFKRREYLTIFKLIEKNQEAKIDLSLFAEGWE